MTSLSQEKLNTNNDKTLKVKQETGKSKIISCITQRDCLSNASSSETSMLYLIKLIKALDNKAPEDIEIKLSKSSYNILMKFY